jgi:hypothetical protein
LKRAALVVLFFLFATTFSPAQEQGIKGLVSNATTRQPAAGDDVVLLSLDQGMKEADRTKTNARGEFSFASADAKSPHLVRVKHQDVNYFEQVPPGTHSIQITVFNAAAKVPDIKLMDQSQVYETKGDKAHIIELFRLRNTSRPPLTQPTFEFYLPEGATIQLGQAVSGGIPVKSSPVPLKEKNKYAFQFPLRPGITQFEIVYNMPFSGTLPIKPRFTSAADSFYVVVPQEISFAAANDAIFKPLPQWPVDPTITGVKVYAAQNFKPTQNLSFAISGEGLLPEPQQDASAQSPQPPGVEPRGNTSPKPGGGLGTPNDRPDPMHNGQWIFLGILCLFLAAGGVYVYTSNLSSGGVAAAPAPVGAAAKKTPAAGSSSLLDAMKEEMFQLETDRLQQKISQAEYESAKAALDKTLQRAMQRQKSGK